MGLTLDPRPLRMTSHARAMSPPPRRLPRREPFSEPGVEPGLEDLLGDPVTWAIMERDGVSEERLRALIVDLRSMLRARALPSGRSRTL